MIRAITFVLGILVGLAGGILFFGKMSKPTPPRASAFLREFAFSDLVAKAGQTNWHVLEDRLYEQCPALAGSPCVARRIVAKARMSETDFSFFVTGFERGVRDLLDERKALNKAFYDLVHDATSSTDYVRFRSRVSFPRRFYSIDNIQGMADIGYFSENGRVTVIVSLLEGM